MYRSSHYLRGFTLIELIVVMGILAILATIVVIAVNPARQFANSRNAKRANDTRAIAQAVNQYAADNNGQLPVGITTTPKTVGTTVGATFIDLTSILVPNYLSAIPTDPTSGTAADTKYTVYVDPNNRVVASAAVTELNIAIDSQGTYPNAVMFDGTNDYIQLASGSQFQMTGSSTFTFEAWIKWPASQRSVFSVAAGNYSNAAHWDVFAGGTTLGFHTGFAAYNVPSTGVVDQWTHIALVANGANFTAYVNGVSQGTGSGFSVYSTATGAQIGFGNYNYFTNAIDEIRISNNLRYTGNFTPTRRFATDANTIGHWHLDEGNGTLTSDASSNANTGTFMNSTSNTPAANGTTNGPRWITTQ